MKNLILVRHAKSNWAYLVEDFDRPLTELGVKRAEKTALFLKEKLSFLPDLWLSSPANRALHTATVFAKVFNTLDLIKINQKLYTFSFDELESSIKMLDDKIETAIVFCHNEAITDFINHYGDVNVENVKTAGGAFINFETNNWHKIEEGKTIFLF